MFYFCLRCHRPLASAFGLLALPHPEPVHVRSKIEKTAKSIFIIALIYERPCRQIIWQVYYIYDLDISSMVYDLPLSFL